MTFIFIGIIEDFKEEREHDTIMRIILIPNIYVFVLWKTNDSVKLLIVKLTNSLILSLTACLPNHNRSIVHSDCVKFTAKYQNTGTLCCYGCLLISLLYQ